MGAGWNSPVKPKRTAYLNTKSDLEQLIKEKDSIVIISTYHELDEYGNKRRRVFYALTDNLCTCPRTEPCSYKVTPDFKCKDEDGKRGCAGAPGETLHQKCYKAVKQEHDVEYVHPSFQGITRNTVTWAGGLQDGKWNTKSWSINGTKTHSPEIQQEIERDLDRAEEDDNNRRHKERIDEINNMLE
eukprot:GFUD01046524.1.p1 GENE.GFUD01046524.1~~GFUD01046524.1.p1  ORF type:complete len:186 (+),score=24.80 GFUD01046524.1:56-613(+)